MKIAIDNRIPGLEERIRLAHPEIDLAVLSRKEMTPEAVRDAEALIVRTHTRCNASLLEGSKVRLVGTATIGKNHIDSRWCEKNGIRVVNAPGCNAPAVMQYVACGLAKAGFDPEKDTLGVVGKGHIGSLVVDLMRGAGCKVLVCDPPRREAGMNDEDYLELGELLGRCDAVTFHVPLTRPVEGEKHPTLHLLDNGKLTKADRLRIILNASRGGVVDAEVISSNKERTLVIDTWPFEDDSDFKGTDAGSLVAKALISTPHIAGYSRQGKERATRKMIEALNETFGLHIGTEGLADYDFYKNTPALEAVVSSYDFSEDSAMFKANPESLERLRNDYRLRDESLFLEK